MTVNLSIEQLESIFTQAVAAEAEATGKDSTLVATEWSLVYADAALTVFEQYRPHNQKAPALLRAARAWLRTGSPKALRAFTQARTSFANQRDSGRKAGARHASRAIIEAVRAVDHPFPVDCLAEAAAALREAETYASQRPLNFRM